MVGSASAGICRALIEIDTRFGATDYKPDANGNNPEHRYLLDGAALVPTLETEGPTCAGGLAGRRYRPRVEGAFNHILRCGSDPATYYFEVRDRDGTKYIDGGPGGRLAGNAPPFGVARFHLTEVVDTYGTRLVINTHSTRTPPPPSPVASSIRRGSITRRTRACRLRGRSSISTYLATRRVPT